MCHNNLTSYELEFIFTTILGFILIYRAPSLPGFQETDFAFPPTLLMAPVHPFPGFSPSLSFEVAVPQDSDLHLLLFSIYVHSLGDLNRSHGSQYHL